MDGWCIQTGIGSLGIYFPKRQWGVDTCINDQVNPFTYCIQLRLFYLLNSCLANSWASVSNQLGQLCIQRGCTSMDLFMARLPPYLCYLSLNSLSTYRFLLWWLFSGYCNESEFRNDIQLDFFCPEEFLGVLGSHSI